MHKQYFSHLKGVTVHVKTGINHDVCRKCIPAWRCLVLVFRSRYLKVLSPDLALCASLVHECCSPAPRKTLAHPSSRQYQVDPPDQGSPEAHENPQSHFQVLLGDLGNLGKVTEIKKIKICHLKTNILYLLQKCNEYRQLMSCLFVYKVGKTHLNIHKIINPSNQGESLVLIYTENVLYLCINLRKMISPRSPCGPSSPGGPLPGSPVMPLGPF